MKKFLKFIIIFLILSIISISLYICKVDSEIDLKQVKSQTKLSQLYNNNLNETSNIFIRFLTLPWSLIGELDFYYGYSDGIQGDLTTGSTSIPNLDTNSDIYFDSAESSTSVSKDYSTTNIQVENVDEADITKTDGSFIYSISDSNVAITDARDANNIKIASKIAISSGIPQDLILYNNKLVVISADTSYTYNSNTIVDIYNIDNKEAPTKIKNFKLFEPYYTSRCINNRLYVIASGRLKKQNNDIVPYYNEDNKQIKLDLNNMYYLKNVDSQVQTLISTINLDNPTENISLQSYLIDISNAYVSENNIYLLNKEYDYSYYNDIPPISSLFTLKGAIGPFFYESENNDIYSYYTTCIYKFNITKDGFVQYDTKTKVSGQTINQFSVDEFNGNLRVALYDNNGSRVVIFNNELKKIGETSYLAPGETMYSSRFIGNKAYLVTYKTIDPLFVIDLSIPTNPTVLGELKIPGYSTYLHPYDENHLIGIGMETKETINRDSFGKVISTSASIIGMKMALFDVSDVNNPKQLSSTVIGDSRTSSAILTNHKALLFSKEKQLIAIPVNNYEDDFEITNSSDSYSSMITSYINYKKTYISEGYLVYNINLEDGFELKGDIIHEPETPRYWYTTNSKLLRGLYIKDNLFTISESKIKVNKLDNLDLVCEINLKNNSSEASTSDITSQIKNRNSITEFLID